mmetsp:Transcript_2805/g.6258  ORF Transcript_2805/g.6258 Transcript_2805/m.6258 type:complete len:319 (+) Transcript_2805:350-1306(+)
MLALCSMRDSTPPRDVARVNTLTAAARAMAPSGPASSGGTAATPSSSPGRAAGRTRSDIIPPKPPGICAAASSCPSNDGSPGYSTWIRGWCWKWRAIASADSLCRATRRNSVRIPRWISQASKGPSVAPAARRCFAMRAQMGVSAKEEDATSAPPTTSECPFRYLVAECMTTCAPSVIGCESAGVAAVLSTASTAPISSAISAMAAISVTPHVGFAGDSTQISLVLGRTAALTSKAPSLPSMATTETSRFHCAAKSRTHERSAQYITRGMITCSPGPSAWNTAVAAAMPEAKRSAFSPCSSCASAVSAARTVGLSSRE